MKPLHILSLALLLTTIACGESDREQQCAVLPGGASYCLQPTGAVNAFDTQQKVEARFNGRHETMIVEIENDPAGLHFVGLTPFGQKLVQVSYDNHKAVAALLPDRRLSPTILIALLQIVLWPTDAVRAGLEMPLILEESAHERRIVNNGQTVLRIQYSDGQLPSQRMHMRVHPLNLELDIETLPGMGKEQ